MSYVIDSVQGEHFIVKREPEAGIYESWRVVQSLGMFRIVHRINDTVSGNWKQTYSEEIYETADCAIAALKGGLGID